MSTYVTCENLRKIVTPDLKAIRHNKIATLWYVEAIPKNAESLMRLGGSVFAQVHKCLGDESADVDYPEQLKNAFNAIQKLVKGNNILEGSTLWSLFGVHNLISAV